MGFWGGYVGKTLYDLTKILVWREIASIGKTFWNQSNLKDLDENCNDFRFAQICTINMTFQMILHHFDVCRLCAGFLGGNRGISGGKLLNCYKKWTYSLTSFMKIEGDKVI